MRASISPRNATVATAIAVATVSILVAAEGEWADLAALVAVSFAGVMLLKYVPLAAPVPALAAELVQRATGHSDGSFLMLAVFSAVFGLLRYVRLLPGAMSRP